MDRSHPAAAALRADRPRDARIQDPAQFTSPAQLARPPEPLTERLAGPAPRAASPRGGPWSSLLRLEPLFPDHYAYYLLLAALDIMLTWVVLELGGSEVNVVASAALRFAGIWGLIAVKFFSVLLVLGIVEYVGRMSEARRATARRMLRFALAVSVFPVVVAVSLLVTRYPY